MDQSQQLGIRVDLSPLSYGGLDRDHQSVNLRFQLLDFCTKSEILRGAVLLILQKNLQIREGLLELEILSPELLEFHELVIVGENSAGVHVASIEVNKSLVRG